MLSKSRLLRRLALLTGLVAAFCATSFAAEVITLTLDTPDQVAAPGSTVNFTGSVFNGTGDEFDQDLLFLNFFGYDPVNLSFLENIGSNPFTVASGATVNGINLFDVQLDPAIPAGTYFFDVFLQLDPDLDSEPVRGSITVGAVPEASSVLLCVTGGAVLMALRRRRRSRYAS